MDFASSVAITAKSTSGTECDRAIGVVGEGKWAPPATRTWRRPQQVTARVIALSLFRAQSLSRQAGRRLNRCALIDSRAMQNNRFRGSATAAPQTCFAGVGK